MTTGTTATDTRPGWRISGVVRFGLLQAGIELRNRYGQWGAIATFIPAIILTIVFTFVDFDAGIGAEAVRRMITGAAVALLFVNAFVGIVGELVAEQDDGTMLRVRLLPYGLSGHLVGKIASLLVWSLVTLILIFLPTHFLVAPIFPADPGSWMGLLGVAVLTVAFAIPLGAVAGSIVKSPVAVLPVSLVAYGLLLISGVFTPLSSMPDWLAVIARCFPVYGVGLISRQVLLPGAETVETWELVLAIVVPTLWAIVGAILAPRALSAMTRRQSGSRLQSIRERREARAY
ncbi:ABC transporter permease [Georgenia sp. TF02-10]|uniref:ABC transporter permease n=1 Tax=Georgenia sp. TF02-10 TaxID=2917725 RepID=UPI001FA6C2FC|nr:ABC transporter permease [Georgenia sp. TF02-10]UNX53647.1 ABC transporter permease [Georgenia sp. TF02-10]